MAENEDTAPRRKTLDELMQFAQERAARSREAAEQKAAETPRQLFLPGFDIGAFPNHLNRSSFIAPIARGRRKFHRQAAMVTRRDCVLEYTGEQLDEADGDLIMALIAFAQPLSAVFTRCLRQFQLRPPMISVPCCSASGKSVRVSCASAS